MDAQGFHDLVTRAKDGDKSAMDEVLAILGPQLERLASKYADPARPVASTSDLLQESCVKAWKKIGSFEGADNDEETFAMFRAWMGQIVRRSGMHALRERKAKKRDPGQKILSLDAGALGSGSPDSGGAAGSKLDAPSDEPTPSVNVRADERARRIRALLAKIPDATAAEIIRLHFYEAKTLPETADALGLSFPEVRRLYRVTIQKLQSDLKEWL